MTKEQKEFLHLVIVKQLSYAEVEKRLNKERKELSKWWEEFKIEREELSKIRQIWKKKFNAAKVNDYESFYAFEEWYVKTERACHYCEITKPQLDELWKKDSELTKRKRGRELEIERLKPNLDYDDIENLVYCCYWCNNAKTDTFTGKEFKEVGLVFKNIWQQRLRIINAKK